jgi:hypothetical protein
MLWDFRFFAKISDIALGKVEPPCTSEDVSEVGLANLPIIFRLLQKAVSATDGTNIGSSLDFLFATPDDDFHSLVVATLTVFAPSISSIRDRWPIGAVTNL